MYNNKYLVLLVILLTLIMNAFMVVNAQDDEDAPPSPFAAPPLDRPVGLVAETDRAEAGYILIPIIQSRQTLLMANDGRIVNTWESEHYPSASAYLLDNGNLLRTASIDGNPFGFDGRWGFVSGRLEEYSWDGELLWSFEQYSDDFIGHHDIERLPNGNILWIMFERFSAEEAIAAGRDPELLPEDPNEMWGEKVVEIDPTTNEIVWEWRLWDHLIQDFDPDADNYGDVAANPQKVDINFKDADIPSQTNWWHVNSIDYNPHLDQITLSPRTYSEVWIIDHSISTEDASGSAGDLLYRWGNPETHDSTMGTYDRLYFQHDAQWIPEGYPGAGHLLIFDNGGNSRPNSRVVEIAPDVDADGHYVTGSAEVIWEYVAENPSDFYSPLISGMQRQPNGNTLITEGLNGHIFEVTPDGEIVWDYYLPPAVWAFRAERFNYPAMTNFDVSHDLGYEGGIIWAGTCDDGSQVRLHEYLPQEFANMQLFMDTHGEAAEEKWIAEACIEREQ